MALRGTAIRAAHQQACNSGTKSRSDAISSATLECPSGARIIALVLVLYIASPIDLLPDFIPVVGFLDDILIVMVGAGLILRSVPPYVIEEHLQRYEQGRLPEQRRLPSPQR